jgi:hypothetical protein
MYRYFTAELKKQYPSDRKLNPDKFLVLVLFLGSKTSVTLILKNGTDPYN